MTLRRRDSSSEAAAAFRRVQEAADRLLKAVRTYYGLRRLHICSLCSMSLEFTIHAHGTQEVPHSPAAAAAAEARRSWQGSRRPQQEPTFWQTAGRRRATPLLFSAACIVGGCALFVGAVQANQHLCANPSGVLSQPCLLLDAGGRTSRLCLDVA